VQTIAFASGATSGWHSHPGPVLIQVVSGTMTFYESNDPMGDHAHIARNETGAPAVLTP
jgi:quercetin dioxygenase-like cupin family protein